MGIQSIVSNELVENSDGIWLLKGHEQFGYSDGVSSEKYLEHVFTNVTDLSCGSAELARFIKDWPSEYHLTRKRTQLLSGFTFDPSLKVLEVGCGCGAITRFLGETFDDVVSVEGSQPRARLAKMRTRDLSSVSVICAPFQNIDFQEKFDIIFCIGVFEYSGSFVEGDDPYDAALKYFSSMLKPDGIIVIAIENQFGLKYFNGYEEDHLGCSYDGLEGYHRKKKQVKTFGKHELQTIVKKYFPTIETYYPYPDYKLPDCVLSQQFLDSGKAGELVSQTGARSYSRKTEPNWDQSASTLELARNGVLDFFSNSFLMVAGHSKIRHVSFDQLGVLFSAARKNEFITRTTINESEPGRFAVSKRLRSNKDQIDGGAIRLVQTSADWQDSYSLQTLIYLRAMGKSSSIDDMFAPCLNWIELLKSEAEMRNNVLYVGGEHIDSIWPNAYLVPDGCKLVDREWVWQEDLRLNVVVIRAIYDFLSKVEKSRDMAIVLGASNGQRLIRAIAERIGINLCDEDFDEFVRVESELQWIVFGVKKDRQKIYLRWYFKHRHSLKKFILGKRKFESIFGRVANRLARIKG